jgi:magnesium transporter
MGTRKPSHSSPPRAKRQPFGVRSYQPAGHRRDALSAHPTGGTFALAPEPGSPNQQLVVCKDDGHFLTEVRPDQIDRLLSDRTHLVWLDLRNPTETDLELLRREFGFHPLAIEDATRRFERPKIDSYGSYYFLVFYGVSLEGETDDLVVEALHLFIGQNFLVSIHAAQMPAVARTIERWQRREELFNNDVGLLVHALLDGIVDDYFPVLDALAERVESLEERMFEHFDVGVQQSIFGLKRNLLGLRRVVAPERDVLNVLIRREVPAFQPATIVYLQDVYDHLLRVTDSIDTYREILSSALDVFLSLQSHQLNNVVKVLTVASIVLMSAALVSGIYGMNFAYMPELQWRYGYPFALGLMVTISASLLAFFRWRRWL